MKHICNFGCSIRFQEDWKGTPSHLPPPEAALSAFQAEGIHLLSTRLEPARLQILIKTTENVSPTFLMQRLKGRLSFLWKKAHATFPGFSSHFFLRSLGPNTKSVVSDYVHNQVDHSDLVDPLYRKRMKKLVFREEDHSPLKTRHQGTYDLFAHMVLVTSGRYRMFSPEAKKVFEALRKGAEQLNADPMDISMMPDHAHLLLRWPQHFSAEELLDGVKNASGREMRRTAFWQKGGYVGSVGPYPLAVAVKRNRKGGWEHPEGNRSEN